jgi:hypothetical protein
MSDYALQCFQRAECRSTLTSLSHVTLCLIRVLLCILTLYYPRTSIVSLMISTFGLE